LFPPSHSKVHFRKYSALFWTMISGNGDGLNIGAVVEK